MKLNLYRNVKINTKYLGIVITFLLFIYSAGLRVPLLNKPLGDNHEWILAQSLISLENLDNYPLSTHLFRLVMTYPKTENFHVDQWSIMRQIDDQGIGYYTTYPPFAVIFAYIITKLLHVEANVLSIQILGLVMHGISALFLYLTIFRLATKRKLLSALTGSTIYIFATPNLWFYSATYSWDILWHHFSILNLFILSLILTNSDAHQKVSRLILALGIINAVTIYTEFQGLFFAFSILVALLIFRPKHKKPLAISILTTTAIAILLSVTQVSLIDGFSKYMQIMLEKFFVDYGSFGNMETNGVFSKLWEIYEDLLKPSLQFIAASLLVLLFSKRTFHFLTKNQAFVILTVTLTTLLHYSLMIPDILIHEFSSLKFIILIAFLSAFFVSNIHASSMTSETIIGLIATVGLLFFINKSTTTFYRLYVPLQNQYINLATKINTTLEDDEVLFFISEKVIPPQVTYYTKRNHFTVNNTQEALGLLDKIGMSKGKIYEVGPYRNVLSIEAIKAN